MNRAQYSGGAAGLRGPAPGLHLIKLIPNPPELAVIGPDSKVRELSDSIPTRSI